MNKVTIENIINVLNVFFDNIELTTSQIDNDLTQFGMDSIRFIQIIVTLEEEFECEIPDSKLLVSEMNTVQKIYDILTSIK